MSELERIAREVRKDIIRMTNAAGSGHPGGSLSSADILTALYFALMKHDPKNPRSEERDIFILSKGHAAPAYYSVLAEAGYFPREELLTLRKLGSRLQGHAHTGVPGVEVSTGSLGQGLSVAAGYALAYRLDGRKQRIIALLSDGENDEGETWEAAMFAAFRKIDNLTIFIDRNGIQNDGFTREILDTSPLEEKWRAFGWHVITINGHDFNEIIGAYRESLTVKGKPTAIIANTVKGKGVSFMENNVAFHGKAPTAEETARALRELEAAG
ncbi:MAG: transketolase [Thermoplasmata archaeon]|uniref:Transketolase n=1 Tax=Candidatus Sysuiplasma superficiale TaxID=2823368 RepID=A0A8J7YVZ0_9ARCH|nr:transketolase [Candidatus Sysuiplasma superficiale]MBX8643416.1 transketolase [Candidatus Sysuiplasma superficiale]